MGQDRCSQRLYTAPLFVLIDFKQVSARDTTLAEPRKLPRHHQRHTNLAPDLHLPILPSPMMPTVLSDRP